MMIPRVHLNGTSPGELRRINHEAWMAVMAALEAMEAAHPHGRDFYPISDREVNPIAQAIGEHTDRIDKLRTVSEEMQNIVNGIDKQIDDQNRTKRGGREPKTAREVVFAAIQVGLSHGYRAHDRNLTDTIDSELKRRGWRPQTGNRWKTPDGENVRFGIDGGDWWVDVEPSIL